MSNKKIKVTVKFFATLRQYGPSKEDLVIPENSEIKLLFDKYNIPKEERRAIILVNCLILNDFLLIFLLLNVSGF